MPTTPNDPANITIHLDHTAVELWKGAQAETLEPSIEARGGPGNPKAFWNRDGKLICAVLNVQDVALRLTWDMQDLPDSWTKTHAKRLSSYCPDEKVALDFLFKLTDASYRELFGADVPPGFMPTRYCVSRNRAAPLHADTDKCQLAWLFSMHDRSPGIICFPRHGLRINLEHQDVLIFDPQIHHASWTVAAAFPASDNEWRTNVTLFRDMKD